MKKQLTIMIKLNQPLNVWCKYYFWLRTDLRFEVWNKNYEQIFARANYFANILFQMLDPDYSKAFFIFFPSLFNSVVYGPLFVRAACFKIVPSKNAFFRCHFSRSIFFAFLASFISFLLPKHSPSTIVFVLEAL
jgi:hypothetical protein